MNLLSCVLCSEQIIPYPSLANFQAITSDRRRWETPPSIAWCDNCGLIQRPRTKQWITDCEKIYDTYELSDSEKLTEQAILGEKSDQFMSRSEIILNRFQESYPVKKDGKLLDFGCGQGHLLRSCKKLFPDMTLYGTDSSVEKKDKIELIEGVEYSSNVLNDDNQYDVITLVHVLEHLSQPELALSTIKQLMTSDGLLLIQVPNPSRNPFDLVVYDHGLFFQGHSLKGLLLKAGFQVLGLYDNWAAKEYTAVCRLPSTSNKCSDSTVVHQKVNAVCILRRQEKYLSSVLELAVVRSLEAPISIFGTSNGASWIVEEIGISNISHFLDEDEGLWGSKIYGKNIIRPNSDNIKDAIFSVDKYTMDRIKERY